MKNIKNYNLFLLQESNNIESDDDFSIEEKIEFCKDFIETFNETGSEYEITEYENGFFNKYENFYRSQINEKDVVCVAFVLSPKGVDNQDSYNYPITSDQLDLTIKLINKSKFIISRLSTYCNKVKYELNGNSALFYMVFEDVDDDTKKLVKLERLKKSIENGFFNSPKKKIMIIAQWSYYSGKGRLNIGEKYTNLYKLLNKNPNLVDVKGVKWDGDKNTCLQLNYLFGVNKDEKNYSLIIKMKRYSYRIDGDRLKTLIMSDDEKLEVNNIIYDRSIKPLLNDFEDLKIDVDKDKIVIKI